MNIVTNVLSPFLAKKVRVVVTQYMKSPQMSYEIWAGPPTNLDISYVYEGCFESGNTGNGISPNIMYESV